MDKGTFGNTQASFDIVKMLTESPEYCNKVSSIIGKYQQYLAYVMYIPDSTTRIATLEMWKRKFVDRVERSNLPERIKSYTLNIIVTEYRRRLRETREEESQISLSR